MKFHKFLRSFNRKNYPVSWNWSVSLCVLIFLSSKLKLFSRDNKTGKNMVWLHTRKFPNFNYHTSDFPQRDIVEYSDGFVVKKNLFFGYLLKIPSLSFTSWFPVKTFCLMPLTLSYIPLNFIFFMAKNGLAKCPTYNLYQCNEKGWLLCLVSLNNNKTYLLLFYLLMFTFYF